MKNITKSRLSVYAKQKCKPKVVDLFAGVGGLSLGFENAGFSVVFANEFDPMIAGAYKKNHPNTKVLVGDVRTICFEKVFEKLIGKIDVVIGGPPCQGFSQKGQRKSIYDERNFLFEYYVKAVNLLKPKYFVMENVPNLLTVENGFFRKEIEEVFSYIGYSLTMEVLNAADYGVPQNRKRAVIIGKFGDKALSLPEPVSFGVTIWDAISDLAYLESGEGEEEQTYRYSPQSEYQNELRGNNNILYNHVATKHSQITLERLSMIPPNGGRDILPVEHLTKSIYSGTWTRMRKNEISVTITTRFDTPSSGKFTHPFLNRAITVREAARIQSFPDEYIFIGNKNSQMKQVGNAVPPRLARAIAEVVMRDIRRCD